MEGLTQSIRHDMLLIQALDPGACLNFNGENWYVSANIDISDGHIIRSGTEHRNSPWEALQAYRIRLQQELEDHERIVVSVYGQRRRYRWNGAAWAEVTS